MQYQYICHDLLKNIAIVNDGYISILVRNDICICAGSGKGSVDKAIVLATWQSQRICRGLNNGHPVHGL